MTCDIAVHRTCFGQHSNAEGLLATAMKAHDDIMAHTEDYGAKNLWGL